MIFLQDFLYSVNDEKFYYKTLTEGGDEKRICMTKEEHDNYQYKLECEYWRKWINNTYKKESNYGRFKI